ncbi:PREDICTED: ubiquitin carboxyl-terminal hydrolase 47-like [Amphimedon queenslandica]|uniref:Ubiquitin carboxyl-terminal hydrolase 47 C-terminal domain-containing protein n=1 Tax=Amphimedon queenslandica TaxID=400682 RepID=A0AAN0JRN5_AMPQE|nr:PREDICTED: ubiquitin carboxyl-terminal hydrolase 47-like [Amphimedon queenslandica]|eukprot:XP_019859521.1 PREDICTED: ubiquitin carboxyl-terminal hydrolase 47-like [Amphimedon queenslandica]
MVDLSTGEVGPPKTMRGELGWTVGELKQRIGEVFNINSSFLRIVIEKKDDTSVRDISDVKSTLQKILYRAYSSYTRLFYVSSDAKDYQEEYKDSSMYRYVDFHVNSITLDITMPPAPGPITTPTTTEGGIIMKIISINEENKGRERRPEKKKYKAQTQLSELSGVPVEYIYRTGSRLFPVEISCLDIENKLKWYSITSDRYPLPLYDGEVIYYKYY